MNHRKKHPTKACGNRDVMCKGYKMIGNSRKWWGSSFHFNPPKNARKHPDLRREGWA